MMVECFPIGGTFQSGSSARDCGMSISRQTHSPLVRLMPLARDSGREVMTGYSHPFIPIG